MQTFEFATSDLIDLAPDTPSCEIQFRSFGRRSRFCGRIRTVKCFRDNGLIKQLMNSRSDGEDLIASAGASNGWAGAIILGAIRDSEAINTLDFGVKALSVNPRKSAKDGAGETDVVLSFGGVDFIPGHYLYSDADGILVSPQPIGEE